MAKAKKVKEVEKSKWFIVFSNDGFFQGFHQGGKLKWTDKIDEAKPLDLVSKFETLQRIYGGEMMMEYVTK